MAFFKTDEEKEKEEDLNPTKIEPVDFQCVLLEQAHKLASEHRAYLADNPYKNVTEIDTDKHPGTVLSRIHHGGQTDQVNEILSLCPEVYALLTPYIRISRVEYDADGKPTGVEKPLKIPNFISKADTAAMLDGSLGRIPGAGIKSFKWELAGVQPADVDNNITATLVVFFQSVGDFFAGSATSSGGRTSNQAGLADPTFLDLVINSPTIKKPAGTSPSVAPNSACPVEAVVSAKEYNPTRIKVCAGWSTPPNLEKIYPNLRKSIRPGGPKHADVLKQALDSTRVSLFLQQVRHDIEFNEDGSLTLTIKYQAALSGLTTNPGSNIFLAGSRETNIKKLRDDLKAQKKAAPDYDDKKDLEKINELEQADRKEKYGKLLANIYKSKKIYRLKVPVSQLLIPNLTKLPPNARKELARERSNATLGSPSTTGAAESDLLKSLADDDTAAEAGKSSQDSSSKSYKKFIKENDPAGVDVNFMYLGDLLEDILANLPGNPSSGGPPFSFFLSEVEFIDILRAFQTNNPAELSKCGDPAAAALGASFQKANPYLNLTKTPLYRLLNIGDIPISLDAFQAFFIKNVVDKERDKYYFLHFVKDICSQLITKALRSSCYGGNFSFFQRFDTQPLSLYTTKFGPRTNVATIAKAKSKLGCHITEASKFGLGMIVMCTDGAHRNLKGKFEDDLKKGIYHNYIGAPCGLLKKLSFQREEQPYLRESKIQKNGALGAEQLRELFSVNIDMVGNNLYRNGSYTYVSPLLINTTQEQLNYLGLHGYYLVTSVSSEVTQKSFTTSIRALQEGIPLVTNKTDESAGTDVPPPKEDEPSAAT